MKGMARKELGEMLVCLILWLLWMNEHHLEQVIKRPHFKVWVVRRRELNLWIKEGKTLDMPIIDVVDKDCHHVKGKSEGDMNKYAT